MAGNRWARRPLLGIVFSYALGTWCGLRLPFFVPFLAIAVLLLVVTACSCTFLRRRDFEPLHAHSSVPVVTLFHLCVIATACWLARSTMISNPSEDYPELLVAGTEAEVVGTIFSEPERSASLSSGTDIWKFDIHTERLRCGDGEWVDLDISLPVRWYAPSQLSPPDYGWFTAFRGRLQESSRASRHQGSAILVTGIGRCRPITGGHGWWLKSRCIAMRRESARILSLGIDDFPRATGVIRALLLGYRAELDNETRDLFVDTGTLHVFAISGLHVGIMALLIISVLSALRVSRVYWGPFLAPLLIAYTLATGAKPSAVRACIMAVIYFSAPVFGRKGDSLSALAMAALAILVYSPQDLQDIGFILSFSVVTGLIVLYPVVSGALVSIGSECASVLRKTNTGPDRVPGFLEKEPFSFEPPGRASLAGRWIMKYIGSVAVLSACAWLVSAPLTAYFFERFTPIALLGNVFVIPLTFLVVLTGCLSLISGSCFVVLAEVFNHANLALVTCLVRCTGFISKAPFATQDVPRPPAWTVWIWYAAIALIVAWHKERGLGEKQSVEL